VEETVLVELVGSQRRLSVVGRGTNKGSDTGYRTDGEGGSSTIQKGGNSDRDGWLFYNLNHLGGKNCNSPGGKKNLRRPHLKRSIRQGNEKKGTRGGGETAKPKGEALPPSKKKKKKGKMN